MSEVSSGGIEAAPTFESVFAADASPASDPQTESPEVTQPAAAQPEGTDAVVERQPSGESPERERFIPRERFDEVNTKFNELKAWKEQRAWAEQIDQPAFQQMVQYYAKAVQDPQAFALQLLDELNANPQYAPQIRSELARRLGTRQAREATTDGTADDMPQPDVAIHDSAGKEIGRTYSDKQLQKRDGWLRQQMLQEIDQKYQPHLKTLEDFKAERQQVQAQQQAQSFASSFVQELAALPLFEEHKAQIGEAVKAMRLQSDHPAELQAATYKAYHQVVGPKLVNGGKTQQDVLADLQRKAHASSSVNPGTAASAAPHRPVSFHDPALQWD